jgi:hypothetical protein
MAATCVSDGESTSFGTTGTSKSADIVVQAGDLILVGAAAEGNHNFGTVPTNDGAALTWTQKEDGEAGGSEAWLTVWGAVVDTSRTITVTVAGSATLRWGFHYQVWRDHNGTGAAVGSTAGDTTANYSETFSTTEDNSPISCWQTDWNAVDGTRTYLTSGVGAATETLGNTPGDISDAMAFRAWWHADAGAAGSKTVGTSAPSGQRTLTVAVEVLNAAGAVQELRPDADIAAGGWVETEGG